MGIKVAISKTLADELLARMGCRLRVVSEKDFRFMVKAAGEYCGVRRIDSLRVVIRGGRSRRKEV